VSGEKDICGDSQNNVMNKVLHLVKAIVILKLVVIFRPALFMAKLGYYAVLRGAPIY
jgi:hypothetical protein